VLWSTPLGEDTGSQNHQMVDLDFDGQHEVVGFAGIDQVFVLDGRTGAVLPRKLAGRVVGVIEEARLICVQRGRTVRCQDQDGNVVYKVPGVSFGVRFVEDGQLHLVALSYRQRMVLRDVYNALTGTLEQHLEAPLSIPPYEDPSAYGDWGAPGEGVAFRTLADTDHDGYWDALVQYGDFVVNVHLPFKVHPGYEPYAPIAYRNVRNRGRIYDVPS